VAMTPTAASEELVLSDPGGGTVSLDELVL
jgi:hypothetical protein